MGKFEVDVHIVADVRMVVDAIDADEAKKTAEQSVDIVPFGIDPDECKWEVSSFETDGEVYE